MNEEKENDCNKWPENVVDEIFYVQKSNKVKKIHLCRMDTPERYYEHIVEALDLICDNRRFILEQRFRDKLPFAQIGKCNGYTRERARQCINNALIELNDILHRLRVRDDGYCPDEFVWELPVSHKTRNALRRAGYIKKAEIINATKEELMRQKNFGEVAWYELSECLTGKTLNPQE